MFPRTVWVCPFYFSEKGHGQGHVTLNFLNANSSKTVEAAEFTFDKHVQTLLGSMHAKFKVCQSYKMHLNYNSVISHLAEICTLMSAFYCYYYYFISFL